MEITFQPFDQTGRARIAQLINKSNQFNLTTKRYTEAQVAAMQDDPAYFTLQMRLSDTFGDDVDVTLIDRNDSFFFGFSVQNSCVNVFNQPSLSKTPSS